MALKGEAKLAYMREYNKHRIVSKETKREYSKRRMDRHPERNITYQQKLRAKVIAKLGSRCSNSGCQWVNADGSHGCLDVRCLQIDHVNGGGVKENKTIGYWMVMKKALANINGEYQLLCANCNWIKKVVNQEHKPRYLNLVLSRN